MKENGFTRKKKKKKKGRSRRYLTKTMTDADSADDLTILANTSAQAKSRLHSKEQAAAGNIDLYVNANKTDYICFKQKGTVSPLGGKNQK